MKLAGTIAYDTIDGVLVERRVSIKSGKTGFRLGIVLDGAATNAGEVFPSDVGYRIFGTPPAVKFPDISFIGRERLADAVLEETLFPIPPDIVAEVVSPSDRASEVVTKAQEWLAAGARLVWVLFPESRIVQVYRADGNNEILGASDFLSGDDILPAFTVRVSELMPPSRLRRLPDVLPHSLPENPLRSSHA